jgi:hypothetical protein
MSGFDDFMVLIQAYLPQHERYMAFGDSIYRGVALQMVTTYYHAIAPNVLTFDERNYNPLLGAARMPIEKNYGLHMCV